MSLGITHLVQPTAASITVKQTLDLFDGEFAPVAEGIANGRYAFWLGSGISIKCVPGLRGVVQRVLEFLQTRLDPGNPECAYFHALEEAVDLAGLRPSEHAQVKFADPVGSWPVLAFVVDGLVKRYAELLDIRVPGKEADYLLWEAVDVRATYPAGAAPGCEHLCLAILSLEGALPEAASANWDGLIESAVSEISGDLKQVLQIVVLEEEVRAPNRPTRLLKFHGCAVAASREPAKYRQALIAAKSQITSWPTNPSTQVMHNALQTLAFTKPTLMVGLSAQDTNIQDVFAGAKALMKWDWSSNPPPHVFATDRLGDEHRNILKVVYDGQYDDHGVEIERGALVRAYAEQLLTALVLYVLARKLRAFIDSAEAPGLDATARDALGGGLRILRDRLAEHAEPDRLAFVRSLVQTEGRAVALFQGVEAPLGPSRYRRLSGATAELVRSDSALATSGVREAATALALLGMESASGTWRVSVGATATGHEGALEVAVTGGVDSAVYFAANSQAAVRLEVGGGIDEHSNDVVMIHSTEPAPPLPRSPRARLGRIGRGGVRHVDMGDLLRNSGDLGELRSRFRQAAAL